MHHKLTFFSLSLSLLYGTGHVRAHPPRASRVQAVRGLPTGRERSPRRHAPEEPRVTIRLLGGGRQRSATTNGSRRSIGGSSSGVSSSRPSSQEWRTSWMCRTSMRSSRRRRSSRSCQTWRSVAAARRRRGSILTASRTLIRGCLAERNACVARDCTVCALPAFCTCDGGCADRVRVWVRWARTRHVRECFCEAAQTPVDRPRSTRSQKYSANTRGSHAQ